MKIRKKEVLNGRLRNDTNQLNMLSNIQHRVVSKETRQKQRRECDTIHTNELEKLGYHVIRFWEHDINSSSNECSKIILNLINIQK